MNLNAFIENTVKWACTFFLLKLSFAHTHTQTYTFKCIIDVNSMILIQKCQTTNIMHDTIENGNLECVNETTT